MKTLTTNKLFTPIQVGPIELKHRVVMAPLTRSRSVQLGSIPGDLMLEYYSQRASDGGLIVSEGTSISVASGGWFGAPGLYSEEQVAGWKRITDAVHHKRGLMFSQLWHTGRAAHVDLINFYRMASTGEPICMAVRSKIGPVSCFKWLKHGFGVER
jgi:N-ethylmaleimide reductase